MIGVCVMHPVSRLPQPLGAANEIGTQAKQIIDNGIILGAGPVIGIVLHIQTNKRLQNVIENGQRPRGTVHHPTILQIEKESHIADGTKEPTGGTKFLTPMHNLENFVFDFLFEGCFKFVSDREKKAENE